MAAFGVVDWPAVERLTVTGGDLDGVGGRKGGAVHGFGRGRKRHARKHRLHVAPPHEFVGQFRKPTLRATSAAAIANCMLNFASSPVCGSLLRSISSCVLPVETWMRATWSGERS